MNKHIVVLLTAAFANCVAEEAHAKSWFKVESIKLPSISLSADETSGIPSKFIRQGRVRLVTNSGDVYCAPGELKPGDFRRSNKNGIEVLEATPQWYARREAEEAKRKEAERVAEAKRQEEERVAQELAAAEEAKRKEAERVAKELAAAEEARRKEAERVAQAKRREARLARQAAYEKARSEAWENFNLAISKTVHPALSASKEFLPGAYSELNASVDLVQNGFRGLPKDEDDTGASAKKLAEWQEEVSKLLENASRTHLAVEKRQEEMARAEAGQILANRARLSALHKTRRQNGASEFTNRVVWATRNCLWDTEREVAVEVMRRTGLSLKDCTPSKKSFPSQRVKCLEAPIGYKYEFGSLSATGQVFLVSAECRMEGGDERSASDMLADIRKFYQFPADADEKEERIVTGYKLDASNLSSWAIYQYDYFTSRMNNGDEKASRGREDVVCRYSIKPYAQTTTTISCDGYDIVVKTDEKGERIVSVKVIDMVIYSELKKTKQ